MKAYRYVYDTVTIDGKQYTHTIPRLEIYESTLVSNLLNFKRAIINFGKTIKPIEGISQNEIDEVIKLMRGNQ